MTELTAGMEAPDFTLESDAGTPVSLSALRGNGVVLYFYPKDNTAGCTTEAQGFRDHLADFKALGYEVLGVSRQRKEPLLVPRQAEPQLSAALRQGRNRLQPLWRTQRKNDVRPQVFRN